MGFSWASLVLVFHFIPKKVSPKYATLHGRDYKKESTYKTNTTPNCKIILVSYKPRIFSYKPNIFSPFAFFDETYLGYKEK